MSNNQAESQIAQGIEHLNRIPWRARRCDTIIDAYNRTLYTGRTYAEEVRLLLKERALGGLED